MKRFIQYICSKPLRHFHFLKLFSLLPSAVFSERGLYSWTSTSQRERVETVNGLTHCIFPLQTVAEPAANQSGESFPVSHSGPSHRLSTLSRSSDPQKSRSGSTGRVSVPCADHESPERFIPRVCVHCVCGRRSKHHRWEEPDSWNTYRHMQLLF